MSSNTRVRVASVVLAVAVLTPGLSVASSVAESFAEERCNRRCREDVNRARAATEKYWDVRVATEHGFAELPGCQATPPGAIGIAYTNLLRSIDQDVDVERPESLLYMPEAFGGAQRAGAGRRLVAVEYRVPVVGLDQEPPALFGRRFNGPIPSRLPGLQEYRLRVWLFSPNPAGLFADANPADACEGAGLVAPHAYEQRLLEVVGTFSVEASLVREVLDVPSELRLWGESEDGSGNAQIVVSTRTFEWSSGDEAPEPTKGAGQWVNLAPPDWPGGDRAVDASAQAYPFSIDTDNPDLASWMRQGMGVGSDVMAYSDDLVFEFDPTVATTGPGYWFSAPDFVLQGTVSDATPADTTFSWRFWHETPRGMGLFRGWHDDMRLGAANVTVTPMTGTPLAELLGCKFDAGPCEPVAAEAGVVVVADNRTPWIVSVSREWWNPRHDLETSYPAPIPP